MGDSLAALVLAAGAGSRLAPLTRCRPKPLCPVDGVALVDHALARVEPVADRIAVNVHHGRDQMERHLSGRVHLSIESDEALGTAGGVAYLGPWLDGDDVLVVNGDTWCPGDLAPFCDGWDRERVRVVVQGEPGAATLGPGSRIVASLLPWRSVSGLEATPSGLYEVCWAPELAAGRLDVVGADVLLVDCATPADYLDANMRASGGRSVVGDGAVVLGTLERSVVWPGATVHASETLVGAIRASDDLTVVVR
jgi:N-acetyl-alpha-D-muramate 1-phosphate uridylyltransferase